MRTLAAAEALLRAEQARARKLRTAWAASLLVFGGSVAAMFQSCSGGMGGGPGRLASSDRGQSITLDNDPPKPSSKDGPARDKPTIERSADALQTMLEKLRAEEEQNLRAAAEPSAAREPVASPPQHPQPRKVSPPSVAQASAGAANTPASLDEPSPGYSSVPATASAGPAAKSAAERKAELATELAAMLRPAAADGGDCFSALVPMLALEAVQPGSATTEIEAAVKTLTPEEASGVRTVRDLLKRLGGDPGLAADPRQLSRLLSEQLEHLAAHANGAGPELGSVALCTRVESFGRYTPLSSGRMISGRTNSAILYVEVARFVQRPAHEAPSDGSDGQPGMLVVQLEEEVELWHADGTLQWRATPASIRDVSRTRRQDFFLVQRIDLPPNLSVGRYNLKVTVRDLGADGSPQTQATIPIEIVADPRIAAAGRQPTVTPGSDRSSPSWSVRTPSTPRPLDPFSPLFSSPPTVLRPDQTPRRP
ncbi:MAG: hypothetical protein ACK4WH_10750 [Phycisphaerales bacterium]